MNLFSGKGPLQPADQLAFSKQLLKLDENVREELSRLEPHDETIPPTMPAPEASSNAEYNRRFALGVAVAVGAGLLSALPAPARRHSLFSTDFSETDASDHWMPAGGLRIEPYQPARLRGLSWYSSRRSGSPVSSVVVKKSGLMRDGQAFFHLLLDRPAQVSFRAQSNDDCYIAAIERAPRTQALRFSVFKRRGGVINKITEHVHDSVYEGQGEIRRLSIEMEGNSFALLLHPEASPWFDWLGVSGTVLEPEREPRVIHSWKDGEYRQGHVGLFQPAQNQPSFRVLQVRLVG